jgi:hypothetical protein
MLEEKSVSTRASGNETKGVTKPSILLKRLKDAKSFKRAVAQNSN